MAESPKPKPKSRGGCLNLLVVLFLLLMAGGIGVGVFFIAQSQDLSDIGGYNTFAKAAPPRDMKSVLKNSLDRGFQVTLTETEINQWIGSVLKTNQGGVLGGQVSLERLWVRLEDGRAEVIMERKVMGMAFTVSVFLKLERMIDAKGTHTEVKMDGGAYHENIPYPPMGGRFGKLVVPQGFLILVRPAYAKLAPVFEDEITLAFEKMARVKIEKNRLVLDPREPTGDASGLPKSF